VESSPLQHSVASHGQYAVAAAAVVSRRLLHLTCEGGLSGGVNSSRCGGSAPRG